MTSINLKAGSNITLSVEGGTSDSQQLNINVVGLYNPSNNITENTLIAYGTDIPDSTTNCKVYIQYESSSST